MKGYEKMRNPCFSKITSFLLVLTMILCMIPFVSAAENEDDSVVYEGTTLVSADKNLEGVYIVEDGTTKIADNAFRDCKKLTAIIFSKELVSLGNSVFDGCDNLQDVRVYDNLTEIADDPFGSSAENVWIFCHEDTPMEEYVSEKRITNLQPQYFANGIEAVWHGGHATVLGLTDETVTELVIPEKIDGCWVTKIMPGAFKGCENLRSVSFGTIREIGESAFENCVNLAEADIIETELVVRKDAFKNTAISNDPLNTTDGVLYVDNMAVYADKNIEGTVHIPHGTTHILDEVFMDCKKIETVIMPEGVVGVGKKAFAGCENLSRIRTPDSFEEGWSDSFEGVSEDFKFICFDSYFPQWLKADYEKAEEYNIYNKDFDITFHSNDDIEVIIEEIPVSSYDELDTAFEGAEIKRILSIRFYDAYTERFIKPGQQIMYGIFPNNYDGYFYLATDDEQGYTLDAVYVCENKNNYSKLQFKDPYELLLAEVDFEYYSTVDEATGIEFELPVGFELGETTATFRKDNLEKFESYYDIYTPVGEPYVYYEIKESENDKINGLPTYNTIKIKIPVDEYTEYSAHLCSLYKSPEVLESKRVNGYLEAELYTCYIFKSPLFIATTDEPAEDTEPDPDTEPTTPAPSVNPTTPANPTEPANPTNPGTSTHPEVNGYKIGDVNLDGKLNIRDATLIQKYLAKMVEFNDLQKKYLADFNADFKVTIKDATAIQKKIANII